MTDTAAHLLGHGSCPACQDDTKRLVKDYRRLREVNAQLLEALERSRSVLTKVRAVPIPGPLALDIAEAEMDARAAIEEATK